MRDFQELIDEIMDFQRATFPTSNAVSKLHHLSKEIPELIDELENGYHTRGFGSTDEHDVRMEYADCFLLLIGSAAIHGLDAAGIANIIRTKIEINKKRKWGEADANGVIQHIKE